MLEAHQVSKYFPGKGDADGVTALDAVDLTVAAGETVALIGESGSGKTTLLRLFNRMTTPTTGTVRVEGQDVAGLDPIPLRRRLGYVQQEGGLIPHWTVRRNVELVPRLLGWSRERRRDRGAEVLDLMGLQASDYGERYPSELSGGQRQRVALARAVAADPPVILLDEPFGALDALTRRALQQSFQALQRRLGKTLLLVTHDLDEALLLADRVGVMQGGKLLQLAAPEALLAAPGDPYVASLLEMRRGGFRPSIPPSLGERTVAGTPGSHPGLPKGTLKGGERAR